ncbi:hypothetical protein CEUSTIGMA_g993.t1 [Chlamydomonas eustigma]|uniref:NADP-dependent oxidoreductase domain-containing protein n=1 Tax=Chlamydomonas eustigma TaxID=1157962 RepID=A0A250WS92_9CHLO|nr:hypothetical protein CEUSTIGMA_g993.t1 [Chlamydomonas eustigma]|eukprot:GAX73542.1 hypothetical protein CEUSTIGMA_g993.t1 [Chlamydomonas eustigma]
MGFKQQLLGSSNLSVPIVCVGTMTFGEQNTEEEAFEMLDYCLERGAIFLDTAELYPVPVKKENNGMTEKIIGRWLESRKCRDKIILASKVHGGMFSKDIDRSFIVANRSEPPSTEIVQPKLDEANIRAACEASLRRLKTDYLDLYQIHWPERYAPIFGARQYLPSKERPISSTIDEQVIAMGKLIKEGKIRHWGLSNETTMGVVLFCEAAKRHGVPLPISIQNDFSLVYRGYEEELAEACAPCNYNIGLLAYGPLAGGTLCMKYEEGRATENSRHNKYPQFQARYHSERTKAAAAEYAAIAKRKGLNPTQLALAWTASRWFMGSVIIGMTSMQQLKENLDSFDIELDEETVKAIDAVHVERRNPNCID